MVKLSNNNIKKNSNNSKSIDKKKHKKYNSMDISEISKIKLMKDVSKEEMITKLKITNVNALPKNTGPRKSKSMFKNEMNKDRDEDSCKGIDANKMRSNLNNDVTYDQHLINTIRFNNNYSNQEGICNFRIYNKKK